MRVVHTPTGVSAKASRERSQALNKAAALALVKEKLLALRLAARVAEVRAGRACAQGDQAEARACLPLSLLAPRPPRKVAALRGDAVQAGYGAQTRNYVLHPYKLVKDVRSGAETSRADAVLDGDAAELDELIGAWLRHDAAERADAAASAG